MPILRTPSRLHFGLIDPVGVTGRIFGGVGVMVGQPGIEISYQPADHWSIDGPLSSRADLIIKRLLASFSHSLVQPHAIRVSRAAPEHKGLGTGTQLSLALATILTQASLPLPDQELLKLAQWTGRGKRSAIGIHGFSQGGFLIDAGKEAIHEISPAAQRMDFPHRWQFVLVISHSGDGLHGRAERAAFEKLKWKQNDSEALQNLSELMQVAVQSADFQSFSNAVYEFNRRAGAAYREYQNGDYGKSATELIEKIRMEFEVVGVGQTSWGPTVYALTKDRNQAEWLAGKLDESGDAENAEIVITGADNIGARIKQSSND